MSDVETAGQVNPGEIHRRKQAINFLSSATDPAAIVREAGVLERVIAGSAHEIGTLLAQKKELVDVGAQHTRPDELDHQDAIRHAGDTSNE